GPATIAFLAESAVQGYDAQDRERLIELVRRSGFPVIVQGMGFRPGQRARWEDQVRFLEEARQRGAAVFSMLRTQPFMRPFNWRRGTSLFDGVFHWRDLPDLPHADRDDGAEWSTYYIRSWLLDRQILPLEEGVRRITRLPALLTGIRTRGILVRGCPADIMMFDPTRIGLGKKQLVRDMPGGEE